MYREQFTPERTEDSIAQESPEGSEAKELTGEAAFATAFKDIREQFTEEFGPGVAERLDGVTNQMEGFIEQVRGDFQKEHEYSGITPDDFIAKYGLGTHVEGKSARSADVSEYSLKTQEQLKQDGKPWPVHSFSVPIFEKLDSRRTKRPFPYVRQGWKPDEVHRETFTPKQEERLYQLLTGSSDSVLEQAKKQKWHVAKFGTKIPNVRLELYAESGPSNTNPDKPILKSIGRRHYGWKERRSNLSFDNEFIRQVLNERSGVNA